MEPAHSPLNVRCTTTLRFVSLFPCAMLWTFLLVSSGSFPLRVSYSQFVNVSNRSRNRCNSAVTSCVTEKGEHMRMNEGLLLTGSFRCSATFFFTLRFRIREVINNTPDHAEKILELSVRLLAPFLFFSPSFVHGFFLPRKLFAMSKEKVSDLTELLSHLLIAFEVPLGFSFTSHFLVMVTLQFLVLQLGSHT